MKPSKDFSTRYKTACDWHEGAKPIIRDVLKFCAPGREKDMDSDYQSRYDIPEAETFHSIGEEAAIDLASDIVSYFTPTEARWAEYAVVSEVPEDFADEVKKLVSDREDKMFDLIATSNYNDIAPQWAFESASHGTPALWVTQDSLARPIHFEVVPPHELLIAPGHLGFLDRFRKTYVQADTLEALFNGIDVDLSDPKLQQLMKKHDQFVCVVWGFWLDWEDPNNPIWRMEITVEGKRVTPEEPITLGPMAGSCPLLVGRFNPQPRNPWGRGPGIKALPDLRSLDKVVEMTLSGMDQALMNTIIYPNDSFLDLSEGIEPGRAYPAGARFSRDQIFELNRDTNLDYGFFTMEGFIDRIEVAFYQDGPKQRGDTPPTATQWLDERRRVQKRIGKPSQRLWSELIMPMIQRIEYLGVRSGSLDAAISHADQAITVEPISPLQKAQNVDKVMTTRSNLDLAVSVLQDQFPAFVDVIPTLTEMVRVSGDDILKIREKEQPIAPPQAPQ